MTRVELVARLRDIEWEDFEVKRAKSELPKSIWETVSAFANTSGGWIVLGVAQSGKRFEVTGVDNIEKLEHDFHGTLRSAKFNELITARTLRYEIDGKNVLMFYIPAVETKPVYFNNPANTFIRMGSGDQRATESEIRSMFRHQSFGKKTEESIPESGIEMLDLDTLHNYRFYLNETGNLSMLRDVDDVAFCEHVNITNKGLLTYAGLLMFGKAPYVLRHVPTFCVDYIEIPATSVRLAEVRYTYRIPEQENIWEAVQIILRRLRTLVDAPIHIKNDGFATTDQNQYKVLREALANMVMHCDHFNSLRSCIRVYTNRIEFMNGGAFPLPVNDILGKVYSKLRNPTIAKLFRYVGIAENAGYGMNKLASWKALTGSKPTIDSDRSVAIVTFPLASGTIQNDKEEGRDVGVNNSDVGVNVGVNGQNVGVNDSDVGVNVGVNGQNVGVNDSDVGVNGQNVGVNDSDVGVNVGVFSQNVGVNDSDVSVNLREIQTKVLELIHQNPNITHVEIAMELDITQRTAERTTRILRELGLLSREGSDKTGMWIIIDK